MKCIEKNHKQDVLLLGKLFLLGVWEETPSIQAFLYQMKTWMILWLFCSTVTIPIQGISS